QLYVDNQPIKDDWVKQIGVQNLASKMLSEQESDIISPSHYVVMNQLSSSKESEAGGPDYLVLHMQGRTVSEHL
ncbi:hypothetical protein BUY80_18615, partial [Staphylococcus equorum]